MDVTIVDDDPLVKNSMSRLLSVKGIRAHCVGSLGDALQWLRGTPTPVLLLDLILPDSDGPEAIHRIRAVRPRTRVVVFSEFLTVMNAVRCIRCGAFDVVLKGSDYGAILDAVSEALRTSGAEAYRQAGAHSTTGSTVELQYVRVRCLNLVATEWSLSPRIIDVLEGVVAGESNKQIAARLGCSDVTVEGRVSKLLHRSGSSTRTELVTKFWTAFFTRDTWR